jgi:hypothetical protein
VAAVTDALFDLPTPANTPEPEKLSPDQRRTRRQAAVLRQGQHPLTLVLSAPLRLHPDAAPADDRKAPGLRCGTCAFREIRHYGPRAWPKCTFGDGVRMSHGAGTDIRAYWPACRDYQPKDGAA